MGMGQEKGANLVGVKSHTKLSFLQLPAISRRTFFRSVCRSALTYMSSVKVSGILGTVFKKGLCIKVGDALQLTFLEACAVYNNIAMHSYGCEKRTLSRPGKILNL